VAQNYVPREKMTFSATDRDFSDKFLDLQGTEFLKQKNLQKLMHFKYSMRLVI